MSAIHFVKKTAMSGSIRISSFALIPFWLCLPGSGLHKSWSLTLLTVMEYNAIVCLHDIVKEPHLCHNYEHPHFFLLWFVFLFLPSFEQPLVQHIDLASSWSHRAFASLQRRCIYTRSGEQSIICGTLVSLKDFCHWPKLNIRPLVSRIYREVCQSNTQQRNHLKVYQKQQHQR